GRAALFDLGTGDRLWERRLGDAVVCLAFTPDGAGLLAATSESARLRGAVALLDARTGDERARLWDAGREVRGLVAAPGGRALAVLSDASFRLWDLATLRELAAVSPHVPSFTFVAAAPDCRTLAVAALNTTVLLVDVPSGAVRERFTPGDFPCSALA